MIRLLGFLVGSAVSIGVFLLILGVPDINLSEQLMKEENIETASRIAEEVREDLDIIASEVVDEFTEEVPEQFTALIDEAPVEELPTLPIAEFQADEIQETVAVVTADADLKWHAFWNPFRSRIAAEGFVGQLEKVTGLDYRVVKIKTGVYEVTFAYESDDERREKMSMIASAAGLDLPDS